jgi:hypothetical protein
MCSENHVQNCHCCDRLDCGDNTSEAKNRIAELEAAQQWHPASAPPPQDQDGWPKYSKRVEMLTEACYSYHYNEWRVIVGEKGWRELPPMPGKEMT